MSESVLMVSKIDSFMVNAIKYKLEAEGFLCSFSSTESPYIKNSIDEKRIIILYMDESILERPDLLIYLKDKCNDDEKKLILIGSPADFDLSVL